MTEDAQEAGLLSNMVAMHRVFLEGVVVVVVVVDVVGVVFVGVDVVGVVGVVVVDVVDVDVDVSVHVALFIIGDKYLC